MDLFPFSPALERQLSPVPDIADDAAQLINSNTGRLQSLLGML